MYLTLFTLSIILGATTALPGQQYSTSLPPITYTSISYVTTGSSYSVPTHPSYAQPSGDCGEECGGVCGDGKSISSSQHEFKPLSVSLFFRV
jgi:hypothetical protein